jgi:hypothetical protein
MPTDVEGLGQGWWQVHLPRVFVLMASNPPSISTEGLTGSIGFLILTTAPIPVATINIVMM